MTANNQSRNVAGQLIESWTIRVKESLLINAVKEKKSSTVQFLFTPGETSPSLFQNI